VQALEMPMLRPERIEKSWADRSVCWTQLHEIGKPED
jgi:hypothetical protein